MPAATALYCEVELPKGTPLPRERDPEWHGPPEVRCPADWCHFPDTLSRDGGPLGAMVCVSEPGAPGRQIAVRPIALLRTHDTRGYEDIAVCVPLEDPAWAPVESIYEIPRDLREDMEGFATCKESSPGGVAIAGWLSSEEALTAIDDAAARWAATVNGRG